FQAEDGIRDRNVTGVQTCALPICDIPQQPHRNIKTLETKILGDAPVGDKRYDAWATGDEALTAHALLRRCTDDLDLLQAEQGAKIGRASCRERGEGAVGGGVLEER